MYESEIFRNINKGSRHKSTITREGTQLESSCECNNKYMLFDTSSLIFIFSLSCLIVCLRCLESRHGDKIWAQSGSDWPKMGQIRDFFPDQIQYILAHRAKFPGISHLGPI